MTTPSETTKMADTRTVEAGKRLTKAQREILKEANKHRAVQGYMQRRRSCERLAKMGLLEKISLQGYAITDAGRAALKAGASS